MRAPGGAPLLLGYRQKIVDDSLESIKGPDLYVKPQIIRLGIAGPLLRDFSLDLATRGSHSMIVDDGFIARPLGSGIA